MMNHNFNIIRRHRNPLILLNLILLSATLLSLTVLADALSPPVWKASAKFNVPGSGGNLSADIGPLGSIQDSNIGFSREVSPLEIQSTIITSDAVMEKALSIDPEKDSFPRLKSFKALFGVEPQPQSTIINIHARGSSSDLALARATNLAKVYQERLKELRYSDANSRQEFAQEELEKAKENLVEAQEELAELRRATGIVDSNGQTQQLVSAISELKTKLTLVQSEAQAGQTRSQIAANQFKLTPESAIQSLNLAENQEYQEVRQKLIQTDIELSEARSQYTDSSPQVQNILQKRDKLKQELAQRVKEALPGGNSQEIDLSLGGNNSNKRLDMISELIASETASKGLEQQTVQIQNQIDKFTNELNAISANKSKLLELERKHNIAEGIYKGIMAQINRAKIDNFNSYPNVQLIDGPILDPVPETPSKKLILLGGVMVSVFGSISLLLFLESSKPLLSPRDLMLVEYPILLSIAHLKRPYLNWNSNSERKSLPSFSVDLYQEKSSYYQDRGGDYNWQNDDLAEREFERLAAIFRSLSLDNRRVMITSATSGEGKTTITLGLAISLQKLGFRVLLVDGDLQRCSLSNHLGFAPKKQEVDRVEIQPTVNLSYGLDLIPAPAVPKEGTAQFFAQGNFKEYLDRVQLKGNYDYVLVDTSPVHLTSEPMLMASIIENVLFVVKPGTSDRHSVLNSLEQLKLHKAQIKGLILNGVNSPNTSYRYGYKPQLTPAVVTNQAVAVYDSHID